MCGTCHQRWRPGRASSSGQPRRWRAAVSKRSVSSSAPPQFGRAAHRPTPYRAASEFNRRHRFLVSCQRCLTPRSSGEPTAGRPPWRVYHPLRAAGCRLPLNSNVRRRVEPIAVRLNTARPSGLALVSFAAGFTPLPREPRGLLAAWSRARFYAGLRAARECSFVLHILSPALLRAGFITCGPRLARTPHVAA
jgi:hypothetical protein